MGKQVLIVDDDEDDCDLLSDAVKTIDEEITCEKVFSSKSALTVLKANYKPDFIFLDLNMPMSDGKVCLVEIRKMKSLLNVPIIIYTTSKRQGDEEKTRELGANYFLTKFCTLEELRAELSFIFLNKWKLSA